MARSTLIHHLALCRGCSETCSSRMARTWASKHAKATGHVVELQLVYQVRPRPRERTIARFNFRLTKAAYETLTRGEGI
ncbi:MAG: hypothetical protein ACYCZB_18170 [Acidiphilium sp.]